MKNWLVGVALLVGIVIAAGVWFVMHGAKYLYPDAAVRVPLLLDGQLVSTDAAWLIGNAQYQVDALTLVDALKGELKELSNNGTMAITLNGKRILLSPVDEGGNYDLHIKKPVGFVNGRLMLWEFQLEPLISFAYPGGKAYRAEGKVHIDTGGR